MKESISSRIRRIITGTANSIVSKIEGLAPEAVLKQAIREVDGAIDEVRSEMGRVTAQKHHVSKAISKLNQEHTLIEEQLETAIKEGRKDLVEIAVSRHIDIEDQLPTLETQLGECSSQLKELDQAITGLVAKRNEMEDELFTFKETQQTASVDSGVSDLPGTPSGSSAVDKAERAERTFTRVLQDSSGVRRSSMQTSTEEAAGLLELAQMNRRTRIDARLKELENRDS
ncbi:MAG: PspA/IM30 family protein [Opitutae bacterium]|nr:PspA/IM30 family protein [Opitutae bacterium]MBT4224607.1 PspA/IM30 family protein [Opitutae bacterium]MBT5691882.1 PspA/IM30 family protein [Opitutae bacterium]MBT6462116.1 PspA/IM30 family protein [Opitutae bacterium]MBT7855098.1 PspA/IM30 family protein [Opitutae bacterium]